MVVRGAIHGNVLIPKGGGIKDAPPPGAAFGNVHQGGEVFECREFHERFKDSLAVRRKSWGV